MGCTVKVDGQQLRCPGHGSIYNPTTGQVIHGPAPRPLPGVTVQVQAGKVVAG
jgi:Rieske Fe-S protein